MKNYKEILTHYLESVEATAGAIVYQPCDCLLEVCETQETKDELLELVKRSELRLFEDGPEKEGYRELIDWSKDSDLLLESSEGVLFCIPKAA